MTGFKDAFSSITYAPAEDLESRVLSRIQTEQGVLVQKRLQRARAWTLGSLIIFVGVILLSGQAILQSEFWNLFSLLFSDLSAVMSSFQDFAYSLLETMPAALFVAVLAPFFVMSVSAGLWVSALEALKKQTGGGLHKPLFIH